VVLRAQKRKRDGKGSNGKGVFTERTYHAMAETFRALADPTRTRIVHLLSLGEKSVNELAHHLDVTPSAVSHQLRVLRQLGLVRFRREGQAAIYALDDPHVALLFREAHEHVSDFLREGRGGRQWL
jgi:DNA-binding transcriptional ArsR family regulator